MKNLGLSHQGFFCLAPQKPYLGIDRNGKQADISVPPRNPVLTSTSAGLFPTMKFIQDAIQQDKADVEGVIAFFANNLTRAGTA